MKRALVLLLIAGACVTSSPAGSVVRVEGIACGDPTVGNGFFVADGLVVTNAHVVAGADQIGIVLVGGREVQASIVSFDPSADLAMLRIDEPVSGEVVFFDSSEVGGRGEIVGVDRNGELTATPYEITKGIVATGGDIYREGNTSRQALALNADVDQGESGAGLFDESGRLVGIVFASSRTSDGVSYALTADEVGAFLARSDPATEVHPGPCL